MPEKLSNYCKFSFIETSQPAPHLTCTDSKNTGWDVDILVRAHIENWWTCQWIVDGRFVCSGMCSLNVPSLRVGYCETCWLQLLPCEGANCEEFNETTIPHCFRRFRTRPKPQYRLASFFTFSIAFHPSTHSPCGLHRWDSANLSFHIHPSILWLLNECFLLLYCLFESVWKKKKKTQTQGWAYRKILALPSVGFVETFIFSHLLVKVKED